jgi:hypothetical protein
MLTLCQPTVWPENFKYRNNFECQSKRPQTQIPHSLRKVQLMKIHIKIQLMKIHVKLKSS